MRSSSKSVSAWFLVLFAVLWVPIFSRQVGLAQTADERTDWPALFQQALSEFREITPQDVQEARQRLLSAAQSLEARLDRAGAEAEGWRKYLLWKTFSEELHKESPRLEVLDTVYQQFSAGHEGLGLTWFRQVRAELERLIRLSRSLAEADAKKNYPLIVEELGKSLAAYESDFSPETATRIQELLQWLEITNQAPLVRQSVSQHFSRPNFMIQVNGKWISDSSQRPVDVHEPVREWILGTDVRGTGHIVGSSTLQLVPSKECAMFAIRVEGVLESDTVGYNGPARIYSHSKTPFAAQKLIQFTPHGLEDKPASCDATAHTDDMSKPVCREDSLATDISTEACCGTRGGMESGAAYCPTSRW